MRQIYKDNGFNIGNKEQAKKAFKKHCTNSQVISILIKETEKHLKRKREILDLNEFTPNPKNLSGWINNKCWEDDLDLLPNKQNKPSQPEKRNIRRL